VSPAGVQIGHHPPGALAVERRFIGDAVVLAVSGELDLATRDLLRSAFAEVGEKPPGRVVIDLRGLEFIDVSGLSLLLWFANKCLRGGGIVELVPAPAPAKDAFEITGLADRLPFTVALAERSAARVRVA
jgi:anti-sigma B factor antagonist